MSQAAPKKSAPPVRSRSARRRASIPGESPGEERLLQMVTGLAAELTVVRQRLDTVERLLDADGVLDRARIETFEPSEAAAAEREQLRRDVIAQIVRPVRDAAERALAEIQPEAPAT